MQVIIAILGKIRSGVTLLKSILLPALSKNRCGEGEEEGGGKNRNISLKIAFFRQLKK